MTQAKKMLAMVVFSAALASLAPACGGSSGSCGKVQPCGGDVVGDYNISAACINNAAINMNIGIDCPGATASAAGLSISGTASLNADLTYTRTQTISATVQMTIPPSCLTMDGITLTCAQLDQALQTLITDPTSPFQSARCAGSSSCSCSFVLRPETQSDSGTYLTAGTALTWTSSTGSVDADQYCVQGNELHLPELDMTMAMGTIQADTVLTKR
jgi:hypothetical protein